MDFSPILFDFKKYFIGYEYVKKNIETFGCEFSIYLENIFLQNMHNYTGKLKEDFVRYQISHKMLAFWLFAISKRSKICRKKLRKCFLKGKN